MACKYQYNNQWYSKEELVSKLSQENSNFKTLYQNLVNEITNTETGRKVLDRIKRDYVNKNAIDFDTTEIKNGEPTSTKEYSKVLEYAKEEGFFNEDPFSIGDFTKERTFSIEGETYKTTVYKDGSSSISKLPKYTLEEQQEEAIVELLGLMTAEKLDNVKDGKLISLLKRLLKEMKQFVRSLLNQREVEIDKLPDNMTLGDLSDLLAYSNSKLILPGYEVEYTTPDNEKFKTYQEASNHISQLAESVEDVDFSNVGLNIRKKISNISEIPVNRFTDEFMNDDFERKNGIWYYEGTDTVIDDDVTVTAWNSNISENNLSKSAVEGFIDKNKEYEQSKEIIEEWKKVNNIQYNPEEIYSRGQEFSSVVGAYSNFDVNLMMQNLLSHIEDNEKAGGKFAISAYTKPIDKQIGHLEGGGGKIKFKLYPQSNDILWAANTDVYSGSVWDASEKVNKDKKSELLGVSYTKYPSLSNVNTVQPNLASIVDDLAHHHNELGIVLTGNNFRLEYDEDIPYTTKKIIDGINKILDQKYGKLVKPEINKEDKNRIEINNLKQQLQQLLDQEEELYATTDFESIDSKSAQNLANKIQDVRNNITILAKDNRNKGIQPTQTNETLKESIDSVRSKFNTEIEDSEISSEESFTQNGWTYTFADWMDENEKFSKYKFIDGQIKTEYISKESFNQAKEEYLSKGKKEYTSQALINTKIAALKEVAKKQPRSLIRSEVKPIYNGNPISPLFEEEWDLPFQKIPNKIDFNDLIGSKKNELVSENNQVVNEVEDFTKENNKILFNNVDNKVTIDEVLNNILNNYKNLSPVGRELLEKSRRLVGRTGAKVNFIPESYLVDKDTVMQIDSSTNTIEINKDRLGKFTTDEVVMSFLHELAHAQTLQAILNPVTFEEKQFAKLISEMYSKYKDLSNLSKSYGFDNEKEFVAEIYANKAFREELKALDKENNTSYWKRFKDYFRRLIGLAKTKETDNLIEEIVDYVQADRRDYRGTNLQRTLFAKRIEDESNYSSLESKLDNLIAKAKTRIQSIQDRTIKSNNKNSTESKVEHIARNKELLNDLDKYEKSQKWKAVIGYTQSFNNTINHVEKLLNELLDTKNIYEDKLDNTIKRYKDYLSAYDLLPEIKELMSQADLKLFELTDEEKEDYNQLKDFLAKAKEKHDSIESKFLAIAKAQVLQDFSNPLYNTEVETKQRDFLIKEYNSLSDKGGLTVEQYVSKMLATRDLADYEADLKSSAEKILNDPSKDISAFSAKLDDQLNTKDKMIQIVNQILGASFDKVKTLTVTKVHQMAKTFEKFIKEKGNVKLSELNKNLIEKDSEGQVYLKGKYSIKLKEAFDTKLVPILNERRKFYESEIELGKEDKNILASKEYKRLTAQIKSWYKEHTTKDSDDKTIPKAKYLNKELTGIEKEILDSYIKINQDNDKIEGFDSLITNIAGAEFHKLASMSKTDLERALELDLKGITKDKWTDLTKIKSDDIGIDTGSEEKNNQGDIIRRVKTAYRGKIEANEQSLDLETMFRNEYWNGQNFKEKIRIEPKLLLITDIAKHKEYYTGKNKEVVGDLSNTYKRLVGMMERNVYDIMSKHGGEFAGKDINKVTNALNGYAAGLAMTFNMAAGVTNIANGLTQVLIDAVGGNRFDVKTFLKAEAKYTKEMMNGNLLKDMSKSVKTSYFNQLLEMFDVMGGLGQNEQEALRNTILRKFGTTKSGNFLNESGEHAMHSILTQSILDSIKAMDENNNYLDKDGNVTTEAKAASLADMLYFDENGQLQMNSKVAYSGFNLTTKYHEGGKSQINLLIKHKVFDLFGVYDIKYKNELSKAWWGKSIMMFKNFFMGAAAYRYTGFTTSYKKKSELTDDDRFYNSAEKEYIEGTYTTLVRFLRDIGVPNLQMLQTMYMNWNNLTEYERSNLKKATMEIMLTSVILPSIGLLLSALDGGDDDDDLLWFAMYVNRRLTRELAQFRNPLEASKMIQNPVAGIRFIQNGLNFIYDVATPINLVPGKNESVFGYLDENSKGQNKMGNHLIKLVPIIPQIGIDYKQRFGLEFGK